MADRGRDPVTGGYVVVATRLDELLADGSERKHYAGAVVTTLSAEDVARHLATGAIRPEGGASAATDVDQVDVDAADHPVELDDPERDVQTVQRARPKAAQSVEVWRDYAVAVGIGEDEAAGMTKRQIQDATR